MPARPFIIRTGSNGFAAGSAAEVVGNGSGAENTMYCGEYNALSLYVAFHKGGSAAAPTIKLYWAPGPGEVFYNKCVITESNGFTLPNTGQLITFPGINFTYVFEVAVLGPFFRVGITFNDAAALTASLNIIAVPRLR